MDKFVSNITVIEPAIKNLPTKKTLGLGASQGSHTKHLRER